MDAREIIAGAPLSPALWPAARARLTVATDLNTTGQSVELSSKCARAAVAIGTFRGVEVAPHRTDWMPLEHGAVIPVNKHGRVHMRQASDLGTPSGVIFLAGFEREEDARTFAQVYAGSGATGGPPAKGLALSVSAAADPGGAAAAGEQIAFSAAAAQVRVIAHGTNATPLWIAETQAKAALLAAPAIPIEAAGVFTWFVRGGGALWVASAAGAELYSWVEDRE